MKNPVKVGDFIRIIANEYSLSALIVGEEYEVCEVLNRGDVRVITPKRHGILVFEREYVNLSRGFNFKKGDLKPGMILELRNHDSTLAARTVKETPTGKNMYCEVGYWGMMDDNLLSTKSSDYDVVRIFKASGGSHITHGGGKFEPVNTYTLLWERPEDVEEDVEESVELTVDEISEKLGFNVKVIGNK